MNIIDTNIKQIQEKAHVWEIFQHHINAWNEHIKSVDHKIELLRLTQNDIQQTDGKITSLEYTINHILTKIEQIDKKLNEYNSKFINIDNVINKINIIHETNNNEKIQLWNKLNNILKHIITIENTNCRKRRVAEIIRPISSGSTSTTTLTETALRSIESKIDDLLELKQLIDLQSRNNDILENNVKNNQDIHHKLIEFSKAVEHKHQQLQTYCQSTSNDIATFTGNVDILLKRIEEIVLTVKDKIDIITKNRDSCSIRNSNNESSKFNDNTSPTTETILDTTTVLQSKNGNSDSDSNDDHSDDVEVASTNNHFIQPTKSGCHEITTRIDGIYKFSKQDINSAGRDFNERYCTFPTEGLGWTVIQRRGPYDIQENFNRSWIEYKNGFGSLERDFWFGNEFIHRLIYKDNYELRIELEDFDGIRVWAEYSIFQIDSELYNYTLTIADYKGAVPDSMLYHHNQEFSTYDRRNDKTLDECCPCSPGYGSGWWFDNCSEANLNGIYRDTPHGHNFIGIVWEHWHGDYSLRKTRMLIRPHNLSDKENDDSYDDVPEDP